MEKSDLEEKGDHIIDLMRQELEVLETLDNQNIVRILQILESTDKLFIVMELAKNG